MDDETARSYLAHGEHHLDKKRPAWELRQRYFEGNQNLPYAPAGVNAEYQSLREMAIANWLELAMTAPVQRLRAEGFRAGRAGEDRAAWDQIWQPNDLETRQGIVYLDMMVHGRGLMSVWPNKKVPQSPIIRPENGKRVHVEYRPDDPFTPWWAVKRFVISDRAPGQVLLDARATLLPHERTVVVVYDDEEWVRFEKGGKLYSPNWQIVDRGPNTLGEVPFVGFDTKVDADGVPRDAISNLMPAQDAINTIRFQTLLAMQFSAYRQRVFVGYDPVARDAEGNPIYQRNADGTIKIDPATGAQVPVLNTFGRIGVDRALVFPGADTRVFDLPESNLANYIEVLNAFMSHFFAIGQIPPQYLLTQMANLSGDALAGAESTLSSLVADLQRWAGDALKRTMRLAGKAAGREISEVGTEVMWADAEARSFAQVVDAIVKLIAVKFPREAAWDMIPGSNPDKVRRWLEMAEEEANAAMSPLDVIAESMRQPPPGNLPPEPGLRAVEG